MAKLKVITPKKVKAAKRTQTMRLAGLTLMFIAVVSLALILLFTSLQGRDSAMQQVYAIQTRSALMD